MKIFILNCEHAKSRRDKISNLLFKEGIHDYTIHKALYWKDKDFDETIDKHGMSIYKNWHPMKDPLPDNVDFDEWYKRGIKKGEAAVCASSILMLEEMLKTGEEHILALQDDASWNEGELTKVIDVVKNGIDKFKTIKDADILWLSGWNVDYRGSDIEIGLDDWVIPRFTYNAHAIVYSRKGIENILNSGIKNNLMSYDEYLNILHRQSYRTDIIKELNPKPFKTFKIKDSDKIIWQDCPDDNEVEWVPSYGNNYGGYASDILNSTTYEGTKGD